MKKVLRKGGSGVRVRSTGTHKVSEVLVDNERQGDEEPSGTFRPRLGRGAVAEGKGKSG